MTGGGGGVGQSVIKSLASTDYELIGLDGELLGTGGDRTKNSDVIPDARAHRARDRAVDDGTEAHDLGALRRTDGVLVR